ncbi:MAG: GNAT family N-acetyltransferase [Betaproteobacteria bacterium]|nr:GNAT family N-acetyltransferase [Betaproteobacteria bacterium]
MYRQIIFDSAADVAAEDWQRLETTADPFVSREFLGALESTQAAGERLGWRPMHLGLVDPHNRLVGLLPLYQRSHSFGDFSRDWSWEPAWRQAGLDYYPKLMSGVPYTPSPGPRLLADPAASERISAALIATAVELTNQAGASSWQCLFVREAERNLLAASGLLLRRGVQFHWINPGYADFADFLSGFRAAKRTKLKRERRSVMDAGLRIETRHGDEIDDALWPTIHRHYHDTFTRYGNHAALSCKFFRRVGAGLGQRMVVFVAYLGERPVASAVCYRNATTLFGRHWGTDIACAGLHFELCYYQGIEYAITQGLRRFEPGAQGEHKLARGFEPVPTWSAFWIKDPRMRDTVEDFFRREDNAVQDYQAEMSDHLPFKQITNRNGL